MDTITLTVQGVISFLNEKSPFFPEIICTPMVNMKRLNQSSNEDANSILSQQGNHKRIADEAGIAEDA